MREEILRKLNPLLRIMPEELQDYKRQLQRITQGKCSSWLSVNPSEDEYSLSHQMSSEIRWLADTERRQKPYKHGVMDVERDLMSIMLSIVKMEA
jgi:hypothetical protein